MTDKHKIQTALEWAADAIKAQDGGDQATDTGWKSDEALAHWLAIKSLMATPEDIAEGPRLKNEAISRVRGGPTVDDPERPYCKPDQSCCDFTCGN